MRPVSEASCARSTGFREGGEVLPPLIVKGNAERGHEKLTLMRA